MLDEDHFYICALKAAETLLKLFLVDPELRRNSLRTVSAEKDAAEEVNEVDFIVGKVRRSPALAADGACM